VTTDFEGHSRIVAGLCGDAAIVDMGAFELPAQSCSPAPTGGGGGQSGGQTGGAGAALTAATPTVGAVHAGANGITVTIGCQGTANQICDGDGSLYATEHKLVNKVVSLSRRRHRTIVVLVGHKHFTLHAGQTLKLTIPLNSTGRALLRRFGRLPVKLVLTVNAATGKVTVTTRQTMIKEQHRHKH
jgi:hypothetical protein